MMRCLNCGNKAKRDCLYYRCRSCCRGHGFPCQTHVKSTWVPATRQVVQDLPASSSATQPPHHHEHHQQDERQQRLSDIPSSSSGFGGHFPSEVSGEVTFTRVQVAITSEENAYMDHEYAYETTINIRGHVFRGVLYEQGPHQPMMNTRDIVNVIVGDEDQPGSTINMQSNLQSIDNPRPSSSSTPPT